MYISLFNSGPIASWRGNRDPTIQSQSNSAIYGGGGNANFGKKKPFVPVLGADGKPVVDLSNRRDEFAGFGGMNRLR